MPVMARCGDCGKQYRMRDEFAGRVVPCKDCGADIRVPGRPAGGSPRRPPAAQAAAPPKAKPRPRKGDDFFENDTESSGSSLMLWLIGGGSALAVVAGIVIALFVFLGKGDGDDAKKDDQQLAQNDEIGQLVDPNGAAPPQNNNQNVVPPDNRNVFPPGNNVVPPANVDPPNRGNGLPGGLQPPPRNLNPPVLGGNDNPPNNGLPGGLIPAGNNGGGQAVPGNSNTAGWTVQVDPPKEPIDFRAKTRIKLVCPESFWANARYPTVNSAFVALGSNNTEKEFRVVYDLRTAKEIGRIGGIKDTFSKNGALSPDGSYFAIKNRDTKNILLWDVRKKKALGQLPLDDDNQQAASLQLLDFASPDRLVAVGRNKGDSSPLWVWSLPDGKPLKTITLPASRFEATSVTFSPGGRYMTIYIRTFRDKKVRVYDLTTGSEAGSISMPEDLRLSHCKGMAFSPDGEELAAAFEFVHKARLFVWDVKTGKEVVHHAFQASGGRYDGPGVQWFPDKAKWLLFGNDVVDRKAGGPVWSVPDQDGVIHNSGARLLGGERIALFGRSGRVKGLGTLDIPLAELTKGAQVVGSGGTKDDVGLPPLRPASTNGAFQVPVNGVAGGWSVQPDRAKPAGGELQGSMNVDSSFGRVMGVLLSQRDVAQALVVSHASDRIGRLPKGDGKTPLVKLERYDLFKRAPLDSVTMTYPADLLAFSPSGKRAIVRYKQIGKEDRIDCWSLAERKHVIGWKPYNDEKFNHLKKVNAAAFVDDDHVLTLNGKNTLVLWKIPECKAVYVMDQVTHPGLSPNGKCLAVAVGRQYRLFDALTGKGVGDVSVNGMPRAAAFHHGGEKFAVVFSDEEGPKLGVWDLKTGKETARFPLPKAGRELHWCGDAHVLLDHRVLVDVNHKLPVWSYTAASTLHAPHSPDGRHWYLSGTQPITLSAIALPDAEAQKHLAGKKLEPTYILKPGMKVGLNIDLKGINGHPNLTDEVSTDWTRKLQARGLVVDNNAPIVLFARAPSKSTGKSKTYTRSSGFGFGPIMPPRIMPPRVGRIGGRPIGRPRIGPRPIPRAGGPAGGDGPQETVSETVYDCRIVFGINGKAYGERTANISNMLSSFRVKKDESASSYLMKRQGNSVAGFFKGYSPPGYVFDNGAENGLGTSQLVSGGARTVSTK